MDIRHEEGDDYRAVVLTSESGRRVTFFQNSEGLDVLTHDEEDPITNRHVYLFPEEVEELKKFLAPQEKPSGDVAPSENTGNT